MENYKISETLDEKCECSRNLKFARRQIHPHRLFCINFRLFLNHQAYQYENYDDDAAKKMFNSLFAIHFRYIFNL